MIENKFNWPLWHWHFEVTSSCTLKCPRCSRTELPDLLTIDKLGLDFFQENFDEEIVSEIDRISFCGYDGDPIYNKEFIEICDYFKNIKPEIEIYIVTNGSYKKPEWWERLCGVLNKHDQIHLSIDGYDQKSNEKYRVNSSWQSISDAITVISGKDVRLVWDIIYFDFNYSHIDYIKSMAKRRGFDAMRITKSNKFFSCGAGYDKSLEPPDEFMSSTGRFEAEIVYFTDRKIYNDSLKNALQRYKNIDKSKSIIPLCMIGTKGLFVDSQGYFYPCCWIINKYDRENYKKWLVPEKNIKLSGLVPVLNSPVWKSFIDSIPTNTICNLKCKATETTENTVIRW